MESSWQGFDTFPDCSCIGVHMPRSGIRLQRVPICRLLPVPKLPSRDIRTGIYPNILHSLCQCAAHRLQNQEIVLEKNKPALTYPSPAMAKGHEALFTALATQKALATATALPSTPAAEGRKAQPASCPQMSQAYVLELRAKPRHNGPCEGGLDSPRVCMMLSKLMG